MKNLAMAVMMVVGMSFAAEGEMPNTAVVYMNGKKMSMHQPKMKMRMKSHLAHHRLLPVHVDQHRTVINVMRPIAAQSNMDINHSLLKTQRLYRSLLGVSTEDLHRYQNQMMMHERPAARGNRAVITTMPRPKVDPKKIVKIDMKDIEKFRKEMKAKKGSMLVEVKRAGDKG